MSLLFIDGADHYATSEVDRKWDECSNQISVDTSNPRRTGGRHLKFSASSILPYVACYLSSVENTVVVGMALKIETRNDHKGIVRLVRKGSATLTIQIESDGSLSVRRGGYTGTIIESSSVGVVPVNTWIYLEVKIYVHDSAGTYDVRINETTVVDGSGVDTQGASDSGIDKVTLYGAGVTGDPCYVDDVYIDDADFQGDCRVDVIFPDGAGNYSQWTPEPSGNDNYENVDEETDMDDDSTHNVTGVLNEIDTFTFDDLSPISGTQIKGVALNLAARKDDAGARKVTPICRQSSTDYSGTEVDIYDGYRVFQEIWENPPEDPSSDWSESDVNASEFGVKLTT